MDRLPVSSVWLLIQVSAGFNRVRIWLISVVGRTLVLRLILQLLPAASTLHSEDGHTPLSGEIAMSYASLSSNQTKFEHTTQLLRDVIARVGDTTYGPL